MKSKKRTNDNDWFRNRLIEVAWREPDEQAVLTEIRRLVSMNKYDEAHITAGLWYDIDVEELGDAWMESTKPGMQFNRELNERRFELRKQLMDDLKAKLDGSSYARLCAAMHPKM